LMRSGHRPPSEHRSFVGGSRLDLDLHVWERFPGRCQSVLEGFGALFHRHGRMDHQIRVQERIELLEAMFVKASLDEADKGEHGFEAEGTSPLSGVVLVPHWISLASAEEV
jgi:hypothetical protein